MSRGADIRSGRRTRRLILIGTFIAVAAAAALLSTALRNSPWTSPAAAAATPPPAQLVPVASDAADVVAPVTPRSAAVEPKKTEPLPSSPRFTVRVLPLQDNTADEPSRQAVRSFYASLLDGLRAVPGLTLMEAATTAINEIPPGEFLLRVTGDGIAQGRWNAKMLLYARMPVSAAADGAYATVPHLLQYGSITLPGCTGAVSDRPVTGCSDPQGGAASQIELMRQVVFPPDPAVLRALRARLLDRSLEPAQRWKALEQLRVPRAVAVVRPGAQSASLSEERPTMDAETLRGAIDLALSTDDSTQRGEIWRMLRGLRQPQLIRPLIDASRLEASDAARLQAVTTLVADYAQDTRAHAALESIALNDPRELVRMVAQRSLTGDEVWNEYVVARLQDASLPDAQRLEALSYMAATIARDQGQQLRNLLDAKAVEALAEIMPRVLATPADPGTRAAETGNLTTLVSWLVGIHQPATIDLLAGMLKASSDPMIRRMAVSALASHGADARAQPVLQDVAAHDADPQLREAAANALRQAATPPPGT